MTKLSRLSRSIRGKLALITGAASGMGRETARLFADEGARLALCDVNASGLADVGKEITEAGGECKQYELDVSDAERVRQVVKAILSDLRAVDILVNCAGVPAASPILDSAYEDLWERTLAINLSGQMLLIRACLPSLQKSGEGRIVNIASTEGLGATALASPYTASKHGVIGLTRALAVELGSQGVTVNCVCPGPIRTGMTAPIPDELKNKFARRRVPLRRYGEPEEVAHAILSLVLPAASYVNGAVLVVDGGMRTQNT